jgi:endonuclease-8
LGRALAGRPITGFRSTFPLLTRFDDETPLVGQLVEIVESRGKWLLIHFSGGGTLATHLLMNGSWHIYRPGERWQQPRVNMRIVIENREYIAVGFRVPVARMHTALSLARDAKIPQPALDVLSPEFDAEGATLRVLAHFDEEIADVLLHQEVLAGVGNEFKSEICFVEGVNPFCLVSALSREQVVGLIAAAQRLVAANILEDSGDDIVTYGGRKRRTTHESDPGASVYVYGRKGEACRRCGATICRRLQGPDARVTFWCEKCQPMQDGRQIDG